MKMEQYICCICHEDVSLNDTVLPCKHIYHNECIERWKDINPVCPLCQYELEPKQMFCSEFINIFRVFIFMCYVINLSDINPIELDFID